MVMEESIETQPSPIEMGIIPGRLQHSRDLAPDQKDYMEKIERSNCARVEAVEAILITAYERWRNGAHPSLREAISKLWSGGQDGEFPLSTLTGNDNDDVWLKLGDTSCYASGITAGESLTLNIARIEQAATDEARVQAMVDTIRDLNHEIEHAVYRGADTGTGDAQAMVRYFLNHGEMRAYAKQFAFLYSIRYPNEGFDLEHMRTISKDDNVIEVYFRTFADLEKQNKYSSLGDLQHAHELMVYLTSRFVEDFREHPDTKIIPLIPNNRIAASPQTK